MQMEMQTRGGHVQGRGASGKRNQTLSATGCACLVCFKTGGECGSRLVSHQQLRPLQLQVEQSTQQLGWNLTSCNHLQVASLAVSARRALLDGSPLAINDWLLQEHSSNVKCTAVQAWPALTLLPPAATDATTGEGSGDSTGAKPHRCTSLAISRCRSAHTAGFSVAKRCREGSSPSSSARAVARLTHPASWQAAGSGVREWAARPPGQLIGEATCSTCPEQCMSRAAHATDNRKAKVPLYLPTPTHLA